MKRIAELRYTSRVGSRSILLVSWLVCGGLLPSAASAESGSALALRAAALIEAGPSALSVDVTEADYSWRQYRVYDELYPLTVDIVGSSAGEASKILYMLPGGSTNFQSSFFTPPDRNLTRFMTEQGYLVIGVSPREDNVPDGLLDYAFMEGWGLEKHGADVRSVVAQLQAALGLPYDILGHSYGAITALDYAARYGGAEAPARVVALDIYSLDGEADPKARANAERTYQAHVELMGRGQYVDRSYALLEPAQLLAELLPQVDSGQPRSAFGHPGNFTFEGLFFSSLIDSALQAGLHSPITGLPGDWLMVKGVLAGSYVFADEPQADRYAFTRTPLATMLATTEAVGSGLIAVALERDVWALNTGAGAQQLDWAAIRQPVVWINTELGYAEHRHGAALMKAAGNAHVADRQLLGYGHGDILWSETARADVWTELAQP